MADVATLNYIPEGLREESKFKNFAELLDLARRNDPLPDLKRAITPEVAVLLDKYTDMEAVQAYHNVFVRPNFGSRSAILYVLNLLDINAEMIEWFEADFNLPNFKFVLDFDEYPAGLDLDRLIKLINLVRSERSRLGVIRQVDDFQDLLVLDDNDLNDALLDDVSGIDYNGVNIWLLQRHSRYVDMVLASPMLLENVHVSLHEKYYDIWDDVDWRLNVEHMLDSDPGSMPNALVMSALSNSYIEVSGTFGVFHHDWLFDGWFTLNESDLDEEDVFQWGYMQPSGNGNSIDGVLELNEDLILDEVEYIAVMGDSTIINHASRYEFTSIVQSQHLALTGGWGVHYVRPELQGHMLITSLLDWAHTVPRYSIGQQTGSVEDGYMVSAGSTRTTLS